MILSLFQLCVHLVGKLEQLHIRFDTMEKILQKITISPDPSHRSKSLMELLENVIERLEMQIEPLKCKQDLAIESKKSNGPSPGTNITDNEDKRLLEHNTISSSKNADLHASQSFLRVNR